MIHPSRSTSRRMMAAFLGLLVSVSTFAEGEGSETPVLGSWLGKAEFGGSILRLVFHIESTDDGSYTGTLDSPDRGIEGIPLSTVSVSEDEVLFEVTAAQARYLGTISKSHDAIVGTWIEGESTFSMNLERTSGQLAPAETSNGLLDSMALHHSSAHFDFYATQEDRSILGALADTLEQNHDRVTGHMKTEFSQKIRVLIYPDVAAFHKAIHMPDAPQWTVGAASANELKMVSPLNPGAVHTRESLMLAIVHELIHVAVINLRGNRGLVGMPKWLNEGYAFFEAGQMTPSMRQIVSHDVRAGESISWARLDSASTMAFGDMNGYAYSATIIEFLVAGYGLDKLVRLIEEPSDIEQIYGGSLETLQERWLEYLRQGSP